MVTSSALGLAFFATFLIVLVASRDAGAAHPSYHRRRAVPAHRQTDTTGWFTFTLPWDDAASTVIDASDLLLDAPGDDPAALVDARGFVTTADNGHFIFSNTGQRVRFWGTNLAFSANFPPSPDYPPDPGEFGDVQAAEKLAGRLAKLGFNAVRFHHMDNGSRPHGLWLNPWDNTQDIDPVQLGRLDYLIYQLKRHGIYVDLNLHVSRNFVPGDGVTDAEAFRASNVSYNKGATLFDPVMIGLQQKFARQLLTHVNPYTGLAYADDPVIFTTETTNENSFFLSLASDQLNYVPDTPGSFPAFSSRELAGWTQMAGTGPTINRLHNSGFEAGLTNWYTYTTGAAQATFSVDSGALRVDVTESDGTPWHVQFGQGNLALQAGQRYRLRFAVRASTPTTIWGTVMRNSDPWDGLGWGEAIDVTTAWVTRTVEFTATETLYGGARVSFDIGHAPDALWFDAFQFQEVDAFPGWLGWLEDRYGSTAALAAAWAPANPVSETELLANGSFELGLSGWVTQTYPSTDATWTLDASTATSGTQSLRVDVSQVDDTDWHVQFGQGELPITAGQLYRLTFDAKSDTSGSFSVNVMQNHDPWRGLGLWGQAEAGLDWQSYEFLFTASLDDSNGRLGFDVGQSVRTLWFDNVSLKPANLKGLLPGERLEDNTVARLRRSELAGFTPQRMRDTLRFYDETQAAYFQTMHQYIQNDLGAHALNTGTASYINSLADIRAMAALDFVDNHFYWDHPRWPDGPDWTPTGWVIDNQAWVNSPFYGLFDLATTAVQGKPFTVTEFNQPFPNRYAVEAPLLLASIANLQDWDGVFQFAYTHDQNNYDAEQVTGFFDLAGNPVATGLMPIAARLFLAGQIAPAPAVSELAFTQAERYDSALYGWAGSVADFLREAKEVERATLFGSRLRIADVDAPAPVTPTLLAPDGPVYHAANGQLTWDVSDPDRGLYTLDAPQVQGAVGFLAGRTISLTNLVLAVPADTAEFAAVTVQSKDDQPLAQSDKMILGVFTRAENTNQGWNDDETSLDDRWGTAPALIEPIRITVTLAVTNPGEIEVWGLDEAGALRTPLTSQVIGPGQVRFVVDTGTDRTLWYAVQRSRCYDFTGDGQVTAEDVAKVAGDWRVSNSPYDLDGSGDVTIRDIMAVVKQWGACRAWMASDAPAY